MKRDYKRFGIILLIIPIFIAVCLMFNGYVTSYTNKTNNKVNNGSSNDVVSSEEISSEDNPPSDVIDNNDDNGDNNNPTNPSNPQNILVSKITLSKSSLVLKTNETVKISASISPNNATNKKITWSSSDSSVVSVDENGNVKALKLGRAYITATSINGVISNELEVVVKEVISDIPVTSIAINYDALSIKVGSKVTLSAIIKPDNATNKKVTWKSSNTKVATIDQSGNLKAVAVGNANITVTSGNNISASIKVTVTKASDPTVNVTNLTLSASNKTIKVGGTTKITATLTPSNATNKTITWKSNNTKIATVDQSGNVKGIGAGIATITATTSNGISKTIDITVNNADVLPTGLSINMTLFPLNIGATAKITATVSPSNATNKTITWKSSNTKVATVNQNGTVKGISGGSATITATTSNGISKSAVVSVKYQPAPLSEMKSSYFRYVDNAGSGYYAYAPSVLIKNNQVYVYSCQNKEAYYTRDHIYLNIIGGGARSLMVEPGTGWDRYHVCDPSVVEGNFKYNGVTYKYLMAYLGIDTAEVQGNEIGLAVSNNLSTGWVKVGNQAYIGSYGTSRWGVGQPSLIYVNNRIILFYTHDMGDGKGGMQVKIINPDGFGVYSEADLSTKNTTWMHNADFAYRDHRLYVAYEGNEQLTTGDIISDTIQIRSAFIKDYTNINEYKNLNWEYENEINSNVSGQRRNTNAGLFRNQAGELYSRIVAFTATDNGSGSGHYSYHIYVSHF